MSTLHDVLRHHPETRQLAPHLVVGLLVVDHVRADVDAAVLDELLARNLRIARQHVSTQPESALVAIQAWRKVFTAMGLRPTQYRCAAEQLLRRIRREDTLPRLHPMVDLCNAASAAATIPIAVLDRDQIAGELVVGPGTGTETYRSFSGDDEHPVPGEIVYADEDSHAHAHRWTHRQSAWSALTATTRRALVVAEAVHPGAEPEIRALVATLADGARALDWSPGDADARPAT